MPFSPSFPRTLHPFANVLSLRLFIRSSFVLFSPSLSPLTRSNSAVLAGSRFWAVWSGGLFWAVWSDCSRRCDESPLTRLSYMSNVISDSNLNTFKIHNVGSLSILKKMVYDSFPFRHRLFFRHWCRDQDLLA